MGMTLAIAIENIIKLRVKTRESMLETQSDFLSKWKDQKSLVKKFKIKIKNQYFGSDFQSKSKITLGSL